jgi:hypothetical protein
LTHEDSDIENHITACVFEGVAVSLHHRFRSVRLPLSNQICELHELLSPLTLAQQRLQTATTNSCVRIAQPRELQIGQQADVVRVQDFRPLEIRD